MSAAHCCPDGADDSLGNRKLRLGLQTKLRVIRYSSPKLSVGPKEVPVKILDMGASELLIVAFVLLVPIVFVVPLVVILVYAACYARVSQGRPCAGGSPANCPNARRGIA